MAAPYNSPVDSTTAPNAAPVAQAFAFLRQVLLVAEAYVALLVFDALALRDRGFKRTYSVTRWRKVARRTPGADITPRVCRAVEEACAWYFKRALCLQRSAVATWLLRRRGVHAELVIGFRPMPVDSHAWVEVAGEIVNDRPQYQKHFRVLERL